nr:hypothetical protein [Bacteroides intestinalis]
MKVKPKIIKPGFPAPSPVFVLAIVSAIEPAIEWRLGTIREEFYDIMEIGLRSRNMKPVRVGS